MDQKPIISTTVYNKKLSIKKNYLQSSYYSNNTLFPPPDPLIDRQVIPLNAPKFSKNFEFINLMPFKQNDNSTSLEEFSLQKREKVTITEKENVLDIYISSFKMFQKLVYTKEHPDNNGRLTIENIVNLREYEKIQKKSKKKRKSVNDIIDEYSPQKLIEKNGFDKDDTLIFESRFESGNLQLAFLTELYNDNLDCDKYQLFLSNDTNTTGYTQWFFFRITNTKKKKKINLSIMNMLRKHTKYQNGIKIWIYSKKKNLNNNIGWHHTNEDVKYYRNFLYRLIKGKRQYFYTLSFDYTFEYDNDEIYFANCIPFTYTDVMKELNEYTKYENNKYPFFHRKTLCTTLAGNDVDYITINNSNLNKFEEESSKKNGIVLFARQHPSETVGSWTIKGAIEFLMGDSDEAKYLRDNFIFKIIPMINVDGVIMGNTRTSLAGCDLNRRWSNPNEFLHPEIFSAKELIMNFASNKKIECIVDFHGHFGAFNSFFYANNIKEDIEKCRFFPFSCANKSNVISIEKSKFSMPKYKQGTGRINLFQELNIENVVTLETSYFGCINGCYTNKYFTTETLKEIGRDICMGIIYLHYHSNLKNGIENISVKKNYPELINKIDNEVKNIDNEFNNYIEKIINKNKDNENEEEEKNNNSKNENETTKNDDEDNDDDDNDDDNISDSESEPSGDNLDVEEIKKLLPPPQKKHKKLKKKSKIGTKLHLLQLTSINMKSKLDKNNNNLNNNLNNIKNINKENTFSLPKLSNKKSIDNSSINNNNNNNNNNNLTPLSNIKNNFKQIDVNKSTSLKRKTNQNIFINININNNNINKRRFDNKIDSETQTEEIFFKIHWSYFIGAYPIISPTIYKNNNNENYNIDNNFNIFTRTSRNNYYYQKFAKNINIKENNAHNRGETNSFFSNKNNINNSNNNKNVRLNNNISNNYLYHLLKFNGNSLQDSINKNEKNLKGNTISNNSNINNNNKNNNNNNNFRNNVLTPQYANNIHLTFNTLANGSILVSKVPKENNNNTVVNNNLISNNNKNKNVDNINKSLNLKKE